MLLFSVFYLSQKSFDVHKRGNLGSSIEILLIQRILGYPINL